MLTIHLGVEGEFGRRLLLYLENHMEKDVRLRHFTKPGQWTGTGEECIVMTHSFFRELSDEMRDHLSEANIIWITEDEKEEGYCCYHPPGELCRLIQSGFLPGAGETDADQAECRFTAVFSPVFDPMLLNYTISCMQEGDLCLDLEDTGESRPPQSGITHMGDLCYYIHLRDPDIIHKLVRLTLKEKGQSIIYAPVFFLPMLEISAEEYRWFFDSLRQGGLYSHVYVVLGCGMFLSRDLLSSMDRLILFGSRDDGRIRHCCESIKQSLQAGYGMFTGECETIFREDVTGYAG